MVTLLMASPVGAQERLACQPQTTCNTLGAYCEPMDHPVFTFVIEADGSKGVMTNDSFEAPIIALAGAGKAPGRSFRVEDPYGGIAIVTFAQHDSFAISWHSQGTGNIESFSFSGFCSPGSSS